MKPSWDPSIIPVVQVLKMSMIKKSESLDSNGDHSVREEQIRAGDGHQVNQEGEDSKHTQGSQGRWIN